MTQSNKRIPQGITLPKMAEEPIGSPESAPMSPTSNGTQITSSPNPTQQPIPSAQNNTEAPPSDALSSGKTTYKNGGVDGGYVLENSSDEPKEAAGAAVVEPPSGTETPAAAGSSTTVASSSSSAVAATEKTLTMPGGISRQHTASSQMQEKGGSTESVTAQDGIKEKKKEPTSSDRTLYKMHKFSLYETASRYYLVGVDISEKHYRVLKIDRTTTTAVPAQEKGEKKEGGLSLTDDGIVYTLKEMNQLLDTINDGNKGTGGIRLRCTTWGLLGFVSFTACYYMLVVTKKSTVALVGGHYIYQVEGTELVPLVPRKSSRPDLRSSASSVASSVGVSSASSAEEQRFLSIFNSLDLTRSFYYSYSYDITHTLQHNILRERRTMANPQKDHFPDGQATQTDAGGGLNSMFVWNDHLLKPVAAAIQKPFDWCHPLIHGYVDQAALSIYGRTAYITVIARRSRHFAGARFLKRGANDLGYVANDVETEQIVAECQTTSFHAPGPRPYSSPHHTSYVQHRGSIPLHWTQDSTGVTPKPPIELSPADPFYSAAARHFDDLFARYGAPVYVLDLVKSRERQPRESKLLDEYTRCIRYLNQFLPADRRIIHKAWDMSRASKVRGGDVIGTLETIADGVLAATGFFRNGDGVALAPAAQNGVARTNCIDCLDRTNAAQFVIGKRALGHQLHALGILADTAIEYDTDAVNLFTHMWHDHGDTIAVQYGGSQLVNTMETYRKINQWTSHSRDMIESFKRYYNNSFLDSQRQEAYNLFLGNYVYRKGQPMLWDLSTDYYLHHTSPRDWSPAQTFRYRNWYNPAHLVERGPIGGGGGDLVPVRVAPVARPVESFDDYWLEYYRPSTLSSFPKMFAFKMNSTIKYIPIKSTQDGKYDLSPFRVRTEQQHHHHHQHDVDADKKKAAAAAAAAAAKKTTPTSGRDDAAAAAPSPPVTQAVASSTTNTPGGDDETSSSAVSDKAHPRSMSLGRWLHATTAAKTHEESKQRPTSQVDAGGGGGGGKTKPTALEKSTAEQWTFTRAVRYSLNPSVDRHEADDYARYVHHPQNLPLVVSSDTPADVDASEYRDYVRGVGAWRDRGGLTAIGGGGVSDEEKREEEEEEEEEKEAVRLYEELLRIGENPLTVTEEDAPKKRYKAYRKWLRGKSFFKQQPLD